MSQAHYPLEVHDNGMVLHPAKKTTVLRMPYESNIGSTKSSSMSRYVVPVTVASAKKKGPHTFDFVMPSQTFTLGESLYHSRNSVGFSFP